jgi:hypothetical protein
MEQGLTYPPHLVGNRYHMSIGPRCNTYTVLYNLAALGWTCDQATVRDIVDAVRKKLANCKGYTLMSEDEFGDLVLNGGFDVRPLPNPSISRAVPPS